MTTGDLLPLFAPPTGTDTGTDSVTEPQPTRTPITHPSVPTDRGTDHTDGRTDGLTEKNSPTETASRNASPAGGHTESAIPTPEHPELTIRVIGEPVQQGSMKGMLRGGHVRVFADNEKTLRPWRELVNDAAKATAARERWTRLDGAIEVGIVLFLERPKSAPRRRIWPEKFPDIDKLARAILDGLKPHAIVDDARIVHLDVWKRYAPPQVPLGARIVIRNGVDERRPVVELRARVGGGS